MAVIASSQSRARRTTRLAFFVCPWHAMGRLAQDDGVIVFNARKPEEAAQGRSGFFLFARCPP